MAEGDGARRPTLPSRCVGLSVGTAARPPAKTDTHTVADETPAQTRACFFLEGSCIPRESVCVCRCTARAFGSPRAFLHCPHPWRVLCIFSSLLFFFSFSLSLGPLFFVKRPSKTCPCFSPTLGCTFVRSSYVRICFFVLPGVCVRRTCCFWCTSRCIERTLYDLTSHVCPDRLPFFFFDRQIVLRVVSDAPLEGGRGLWHIFFFTEPRGARYIYVYTKEEYRNP